MLSFDVSGYHAGCCRSGTGQLVSASFSTLQQFGPPVNYLTGCPHACTCFFVLKQLHPDPDTLSEETCLGLQLLKSTSPVFFRILRELWSILRRKRSRANLRTQSSVRSKIYLRCDRRRDRRGYRRGYRRGDRRGDHPKSSLSITKLSIIWEEAGGISVNLPCIKWHHVRLCMGR